ncbi:expressed unknown protein [Seminavis robusta]|uniref:PRA1 family protein n=1 Tax=Seminavis robusta TaxID=568900 RepID=A0A9N8HS84_9STRA|nr:expressed unknown protein [Seminavis robusta]|eukprot:Sro1410_g270240.1 n/a (213) ;mRNA; r:3433-4476
MMPQSGNLDGQPQGPNANSSLMGFLQSPGTLLQGYDQVPGDMMSSGLSNSVAGIFSRENLRSPAVVLGSGEDQAFSLVLSPPSLLERIRHNIGFYYLNYLFLTAAIFLLNVFFSPGSWMAMLFLAVLWVGMVNTITDERLLKIGSISLCIFSALVLWWALPIKWTFYLSGFLIVAHVLFRDASSMQMQGYQDPMAGIPHNAGFYQGPQLVGA